MGPLIELVAQYRATKDPDQRIQVADQFIRRVGPRLRAFIFRRCRAEMAQDVYQQTLKGIAKNLHMFYGTTDETVWAWCQHVAQNTLVNELRRQGRRPEIVVDWEDTEQALECSARDNPPTPGERLDLEYALNLLQSAKAECYGVLEERFIWGLSFEEVARQHGISSDAARMRVKRCLELAQKLIAKQP